MLYWKTVSVNDCSNTKHMTDKPCCSQPHSTRRAYLHQLVGDDATQRCDHRLVPGAATRRCRDTRLLSRALTTRRLASIIDGVCEWLPSRLRWRGSVGMALGTAGGRECGRGGGRRDGMAGRLSAHPHPHPPAAAVSKTGESQPNSQWSHSQPHTRQSLSSLTIHTTLITVTIRYNWLISSSVVLRIGSIFTTNHRYGPTNRWSIA